MCTYVHCVYSFLEAQYNEPTWACSLFYAFYPCNLWNKIQERNHTALRPNIHEISHWEIIRSCISQKKVRNHDQKLRNFCLSRRVKWPQPLDNCYALTYWPKLLSNVLPALSPLNIAAYSPGPHDSKIILKTNDKSLDHKIFVTQLLYN